MSLAYSRLRSRVHAHAPERWSWDHVGGVELDRLRDERFCVDTEPLAAGNEALPVSLEPHRDPGLADQDLGTGVLVIAVGSTPPARVGTATRGAFAGTSATMRSNDVAGVIGLSAKVDILVFRTYRDIGVIVGTSVESDAADGATAVVGLGVGLTLDAPTQLLGSLYSLGAPPGAFAVVPPAEPVNSAERSPPAEAPDLKAKQSSEGQSNYLFAVPGVKLADRAEIEALSAQAWASGMNIYNARIDALADSVFVLLDET